jgi:CRP-like cAMP-binding protein
MSTFNRHADNVLLGVLKPSDLSALSPYLSRVDLPRSRSLEVPRRRIGTAYFIASGVVSIVSIDGRSEIETGVIGREGMTGIPLLLGDDRWPHSTYMQVAGWGYAVDAAALRQCMVASSSMAAVFLKFIQTFLMQVSSTAKSRAHGRLAQRLARWLLMAHDRATNDDIALTHEFLAMMLAVRRAGVTDAVNALVERGFIQAVRGRIRITDRPALEQEAGSMYGEAEAEYGRLIAPMAS